MLKPTATTKNLTNSQFFPGPFSPQYLSENGNSTSSAGVGRPKNKPNHHVLTDLLSPFHLEEYAPEIEKELHNDTAAVVVDSADREKKPKKPAKTYPPYGKDEDDADDENYDEKSQYDDLFADIFDSKAKHKNATKHSFWTAKPPEIPELVKNPHYTPKIPTKYKELDGNAKHPPTDGSPDFPKKHDLYPNKKQKPTPEDDKKAAEKPDEAFLPYPNLPYPIHNGAYPGGNNLKYPPAEILIHHGQNPPVNFADKFKHPPVPDPNQSEEFYHIVDNDAYNEEQIRQNLHYPAGQHEPNSPYGHVVRLNKDGVRAPNAGQQPVNVEDVLTHLHNENNNNVQLPNLLPGSDPQIPIHHFAFPNYHESLNVDQTSHPLLLRPQLVHHHDGNDTNRGLLVNKICTLILGCVKCEK